MGKKEIGAIGANLAMIPEHEPRALIATGPQHLDSPEAYRRDRRKDMLLQQHGYFVLRFLAEDVGKHLGSVLDAILLASSRREPIERNGSSLEECRRFERSTG